MSESKKVLVTGATGKQGGAVTRRLLRAGHSVRALTRNPDSPAAAALRALGAEVVRGDFEDRDSLRAAAEGRDAAFVVSTPFEAGMDAETRQGINAVDAARDAGVGYVVYTSVASADQKTKIPHFDSKFLVEEHLKASGVPHAIIAPVYFMENAFMPWVLPGLKEGAYASPLTPDRGLQQIALDDIGAFAAHVLEHRDQFNGRRIDIASDELSGKQFAKILSTVTGRKIGYTQISLDPIRAMSEDFAVMYEWFERVGYSIDLAKLRQEYRAIGWHGFKDWTKKQDWSVLG